MHVKVLSPKSHLNFHKLKSFGHCLINDQRIVPTIEEANANQNNYIYNYNDRNSQDSQDETEFVDFDERTTIAQRSVIGTNCQ